MARLPFLVRAFKGSNPFVPFLMSIAQLVEHQVVVLRVMGSNPFVHPYFFQEIAQLGSVSVLGTECQGFKSLFLVLYNLILFLCIFYKCIAQW